MRYQAPEQRRPLPLPSPCPTVKAHTLPLLQGGEPGLEETEATSPIWQGSDSSSPQTPKIALFQLPAPPWRGPELRARVFGR